MPALRRSRDTLADARAELLAKLDEGSTCPCCGQLAKRYKRKLYATMAAGLVVCVDLWEQSPEDVEWIDVKDINARMSAWRSGTSNPTSDFAKLRHWHFVEQRPNDDETKHHSGLWRPTALGIDFAHGRTRAPSHYYAYNNSVLGFAESAITINDALGSSFDYSELWSGR